MRTNAIGRAAGALVALAAVSVVLFLGLLTVLGLVGVAQWVASSAAIGAVTTVALAGADAFTPLGTDNARQLRAQPWPTLAVDFLLAGATGFVVGFLGGSILLSPGADGLGRLVVVSLSVVLGYGTFVARNTDIYGIAAMVEAGGAEP
jgi:hypothetical protein